MIFFFLSLSVFFPLNPSVYSAKVSRVKYTRALSAVREGEEVASQEVRKRLVIRSAEPVRTHPLSRSENTLHTADHRRIVVPCWQTFGDLSFDSNSYARSEIQWDGSTVRPQFYDSIQCLFNVY